MAISWIPVDYDLGDVTRPAEVNVTITAEDPDLAPDPVDAVTVTVDAHDFPSAFTVQVVDNEVFIQGPTLYLFPPPDGIKYVIDTEHGVVPSYEQVPIEGDPYEAKPDPTRTKDYTITITAESIMSSDTQTFALSVLNSWDGDRAAIVAMMTLRMPADVATAWYG